MRLLLRDGEGPTAVAARIAEHMTVEVRRALAVSITYWDTFDGRLHRCGVTLVSGSDGLALSDIDGVAPPLRAEHDSRARRLFAGDIAQGALRDRVAPLIEMRALTPIARVRGQALPIDVLDGEGKIVVRLRVEELAASLPAGDDRPIPARLYVTGVRGYGSAFKRVSTLLVDVLGLAVDGSSVQDDAVRAVGGTVGGRASKMKVVLSADERCDVAAAWILSPQLSAIEANLPGALADVDSEFLHDLRVAVRRTRALLRELRGVFPPDELSRFRAGFKELQAITGPTRDLDVQLLELDDLADTLPPDRRADVAPLRRLLERRLAGERRKMVRALGSDGTRALLDEWGALLDELPGLDERDRPQAAQPVDAVASARIAAVYRKMVRMGRAIDDASPNEALHELRKQGKELRYLLEFFAALHPAEVVKPMVVALKSLQDVLGRFQDREVQADALRVLAADLAAAEEGPRALMAMGVLADRLGHEQAEARSQFAATFERFSSKRQRRLVRETFG